ncbi:MAG: ABC transporter ATP-binding protein [Candidatus Asgardarchaeum californiense]|nr:MAG: ABC transporter ATP-binding protein [Candidatus Asgardarchaeum californiense]
MTVKNKIGYVPEEINLFESLTPREFFEFVASIRRVSMDKAITRIANLLRAFEIEQYFDTPIATLSLGTKQKISIISALIHDPPILILDEPLSNLDVKSAKIMKELLTYHISNGGAILFSTHIMEIAEKMCTRVGIIHKGKLVAEGTVSELRQMFERGGETLEEVFLKVTEQDASVEEAIKALKEAFE